MPGQSTGYCFEFDAVNNVLRSSWEGPVKDQDIFDGYQVGMRFVASHPLCKGIIDFSQVTSFDVSSETIRKIATSPPATPQMIDVIVAPKDLTYGLSRMFAVFGEEARPNLHVVRSLEEAYKLLGVTSPQFTRVANA